MKGDLKKCTGCGEEKPATAEFFYRDRRKKGGLRTKCKDCKRKYQNQRRKEHPEKCKAQKRASDKKYREKNPEKTAASKKKWNQANREKCGAFCRKWREANPDHIRMYRKRRRKEDPVFRLNCSMRSGLWSCLSGRRKNSHTFDYIGLTPKELMDYFEGQFTEGMTRENYGEWHVDHIRPLASFDFTGPDREEQLHAAWSHTNMQPLWASDNIRKGARYEEGSLL